MPIFGTAFGIDPNTTIFSASLPNNTSVGDSLFVLLDCISLNVFNSTGQEPFKMISLLFFIQSSTQSVNGELLFPLSTIYEPVCYLVVNLIQSM